MASLKELKSKLKERVREYPRVEDEKQKEIITQETAELIRQINAERNRISENIPSKTSGDM